MYPGETKIFSAILLASALIGIIVICFIIVIVRNHKKFLQLHHQQLITEITALEHERKRIVRDLHDDLGPLLAAVKFQIATLDTTLRHDLVLIGKASGNIDNILCRIREICNDLLPDVLTRKGLFMAVNELIQQLDPHCRMHIVFNCQPAHISLQAQLHLYRMIQEMINNAIKHSDATRLQIDIIMNNERLTLEVSDDGKGFDTDAVICNNPGLGIKNIFGRTRMLNGDMYLVSGAKGTTYKIEIPIPCNELQDTIGDRR